MNNVDKIIKMITELSVAEFVILIEKLSQELKVDLSMLSAPVAAAAPVAQQQESEEEEESAYKINVKGYTCDKPAAMKALRALLGTSLIETKGIIDGLPYNISDKPYSKAEAEEVSKNLKAQGFDAEVIKA